MTWSLRRIGSSSLTMDLDGCLAMTARADMCGAGDESSLSFVKRPLERSLCCLLLVFEQKEGMQKPSAFMGLMRVCGCGSFV